MGGVPPWVPPTEGWCPSGWQISAYLFLTRSSNAELVKPGWGVRLGLRIRIRSGLCCLSESGHRICIWAEAGAELPWTWTRWTGGPPGDHLQGRESWEQQRFVHTSETGDRSVPQRSMSPFVTGDESPQQRLRVSLKVCKHSFRRCASSHRGH